MALAVIADLEKISKTFSGKITVGDAEGCVFTIEQANIYLSDELALMNFKYTTGGDLSVLPAACDTRKVMVRLQCLYVLRSHQGYLGLDEAMIANLNKEIERWELAFSHAQGITLVDLEPTSIVETPIAIKIMKENLPNVD